MIYVAHNQFPTSVRHSIKCSFLKSDSLDLILAKHNQIEIYSIETHQLQIHHQLPIFGLIQHIQSYLKPGNQTATLLVLTSDLNLFTLRFCQKSHSIITTASLSLAQPSARSSDYLQTSIVDPHARCVLVHALNGILHLIPLQPIPSLSSTISQPKTKSIEPDTELFDILQLRLNEVNVHALAFASLPAYRPPTLLIVYSNHLANRVLRARPIDLTRANCDQELCPSHECSDPGAGLIIPIYDKLGTMLIVGEESVQLVKIGQPSGKGKGKQPVEHTSSQQLVVGPKTDLPLGSYTCYSQVDDEPDLWILGDTYGQLLLIHLTRRSDNTPLRLSYELAGTRVPSPEALVYLPNRHLYLASHYGDSQLLKLNGTSDPDLIITHSNLAPIADAVRVEKGLVTCSGAYQDGSLRIISHGISLESESENLPIYNIEKVWCLKEKHILVLGFRNETRFIYLNNEADDAEEKESVFGFINQTRTIVVGICDGKPIQVTENEVLAGEGFGNWRTRSMESGLLVIKVGVIGSKHIAVGIGKEIFLLELRPHLVQSGSMSFEHDISALAIDHTSSLLAVGQWTTNTIILLSLPTLAIQSVLETHSSYGLHSLLFAPLARNVYLLAGLDDGTLLALKMEGIREVWRRKITVGLEPVSLSAVSVGLIGALENVAWVHSDRANLLRETRPGRLTLTPLSETETSLAININSKGLLAVIEPSKGLKLGRINNLENKVQVSKLDLGGEQPRRIAHSLELGAFAVICVLQRLDQDSGTVERYGSVKILDDQTFELLWDFQLLSVEQGTSVAAINLGPKLEPHFVIGTGLVEANERESRSGRIIGISLTNKEGEHNKSKRNFQISRICKVTGAVQGIGSLPKGKLVASANAFVHVFQIDQHDGFELLDTWGGGFVSQTIITESNWILVGDLYKSIVILEFNSNKNQLKVLGRDYNAIGVRPIGKINDRVLVGADTEFNLFSVELIERKEEEEDQKEEEEEEVEMVDGDSQWDEEERRMKLEKVFWDDKLIEIGCFGLGENVNKLINGSLNIGKHLNLEKRWQSKLIFISSTGGIGVLIEIVDESIISRLLNCEAKLRKLISNQTIGGLEPIKYRKFKSKWRESDPIGFIDGDLLQAFSDSEILDNEDQELIEELKRLH
ncbi:hypothetical protein CROQUDRAFT_92830 [Cronartium quercuum f. sp. fusiforme G11]|uniref:DNA damage-binding protein 1 n=1 Tax=Cronartium quercuum f. sp. fusiforme G11 TaxID=708437 RepID=A0A9P6NI35_9BASI|nr:hypothetical protein CROQUDRAFT_92830 [Cronartium quercuum f. sp. fusiforme G11]